MADNFFTDGKDYKTDTLTGLYDRNVIVEYADYLMKKNVPFCIALIDIDNFKNVNDTYGHEAGDRVIKLVADKLKEEIGNQGLVGRFGGDEFLFVVENIADYDAVWTFCRTLLKQIDGIPIPDLKGCFVTCTTGLSRFPIDGDSYKVLMEKTDKALYRGKQKGRSCFIIYLDDKHKNITLHSDVDKSASIMQKITTIYRIFGMKTSLQERIKTLFERLSSSIMIDHIAIQSHDRLLFSTVNPLSKAKEFSFIENELFENNISEAIGIFYINDRLQLKLLKQHKLYASLYIQSVKALAYAPVRYGDKLYGYLRADTTSHTRIWQYGDLELLVIIANAIAAELHYQNIELNDLS